ncbi:hypothetical protein GQ85_43845, partial [Rhodococcus rhodochrous]
MTWSRLVFIRPLIPFQRNAKLIEYWSRRTVHHRGENLTHPNHHFGGSADLTVHPVGVGSFGDFLEPQIAGSQVRLDLGDLGRGNTQPEWFTVPARQRDRQNRMFRLVEGL